VFNSTKDGVKLEIRRTAGSGPNTVNCHMFVIADAAMTVKDADLKSIVY
jgi:hypothetical protein